MTRPAHPLPERLPAGERVLWQGAPDWRGLARHALHLRGLALYLGLVVAWVAFSALHRGDAPGTVLAHAGLAVLAASLPLALGLAYAWFAARSACYTITNRRVVIRLGVAMQMTLNLPFSRIDSADLALRADGSGDLALRLAPGSRGVSFLVLWPHARPWRLGGAQPTLRALPDAARAGQVLARALAESADLPVVVAQETVKVDTGLRQRGLTAAA